MTHFLNNLQPLCAALVEPRHMTSPAPWAGHTPFAMWLVQHMQPRCLVELGAYSGISYLTFCQAVLAEKLDTACYAVDTWVGDEHAGTYGEHIYQTLRANHDPHYAHFSTLLRKTFDEALADFADHSIDLLHIDGLHTYDAVKHDFETWLPKLSDRAIVLFHDTEVRRDDFGVWKFWQEVCQSYPGFSFEHSHGLGVLFVGPLSRQPFEALGVDVTQADSVQALRQLFRALGAAQEWRAELHGVQHALGEAEQALSDARGQIQNVPLLEQQIATLSAASGLPAQVHSEYQRVIASQHDWILQQDQTILAHEQECKRLQVALIQAEHTRAELQRVVASQHGWIVQQDQLILAKDRVLGHKDHHLGALQSVLERTLDRRLRGLARRLLTAVQLAVLQRRSTKLLHRARNAVRYAVRGDFAALRARAASLWREHRLAAQPQPNPGDASVGIYTTPHTLYVAHAIQTALARAGLRCQILQDDVPSTFPLDLYIVLCAQMFTHLPPGEKRIAFQMEQTVSNRWFDRRYLDILENSRAVLDYSLANLAYLAQRGIVYPHVFHVPLGAVINYPAARGLVVQTAVPDDSAPQVLFYGDPNAPRRQAFLAELQRHVPVQVVSNLFGPELQAAIARARVVVNIHYYEGALLESTRLFECLSLGVHVVSESAADVGDYPGLDTVVDFVPVGDVAAMVQSVQRALQAFEQPPTPVRQRYLQNSQHRFEFMLYRAFLAQRYISYQQFQQLVSPPQGDAFALSLPETLERRAAYMAAPLPGAQVFDGLRARPGWIGCAMSYKYLCASALEQGVQQLLVCEDDVELPPQCNAVLQTIRTYLQRNAGHWDIFVGIIAHLHPNVQVTDVQEFDGITFVTLDKMTSMVFNIYSRTAMDLIARWDETLHDDQTNTIDRYLEHTGGLRVVTVLEPLFGHREDQKSTLWGIENDQYSRLIDASRDILRAKVAAFRLRVAYHPAG